jgi:hypothetical protein
VKLSLEIDTDLGHVLSVAIEFAERTDRDRVKWVSTLSVDGEQIASDNRLESPGSDPDPWKGLQALVGFLSAWAEADGYGENADLFGDEWEPVLDHVEELSYLTRWPE